MEDIQESTGYCFSCKGSDDIFNIFDIHMCEGIEENYAYMLKKCFDIDIKHTSGVNALCEQCILKLRDAYYFKQEVLKNLRELKSQVDQVQSTAVQISSSKTIKYLGNYDIRTELDPNTGLMKFYMTSDMVSENDQEAEDANDEQLNRVEGNEKSSDRILSKDEQAESNVCTTCDKQFSSETALKRHVTGVHAEGPFTCPQCPKVFAKLNTRNAHCWRVHRTTQPYTCKHCSERFETFHQRLAHLKTAHGMTEPQYPCPYCNNKYFYAGSRSSHIRLTHLRVRPHGCPHCAMAFGKRRALLSHLAAIHGSGERPHSCALCPARFYRRVALAYHMRTHEKRTKLAGSSSNDNVCTLTMKSIRSEPKDTHKPHNTVLNSLLKSHETSDRACDTYVYII